MNTKKKPTLFACAAVVGMAGALSSDAANATIASDLNSAYVWRGITLNDGLVWQPSLGVTGIDNFGLDVWANMDLEDFNNTLETGHFSEVDLTVYYNLPVEGYDLAVGNIEYLFPDGSGSTREVYGEADYDMTEELSVGAFIAYDWDHVDDYYGSVSAAVDHEVNADVSLELAGLAGYAGDKFSSGPDSGFHEYDISLTASYAHSEDLEFGAFIAYTGSIDDDVLLEDIVTTVSTDAGTVTTTSPGPQDVDVYGGVSVAYSF